MAEKEDESSDLLYVGVGDANIVRKNILEAQKEIILNLKHFEEFNDLRSRKLAMIDQYMKVLKEIDILNSKLRKAMPKVAIKPLPVIQVNSPVKAPVEKKSRIITPHEFMEKQDRLKRLESDLDNVEGQLGDLVGRRKK